MVICLKSNKSRLGQNFILDENILSEIVDFCNVKDTDDILEIGPGPGILTEMIAKKSQTLTSIEIDDKLIPNLMLIQSRNKNLNIIHCDILKCNLAEIMHDKYFKVIANIPYYISSEIFQLLFRYNHLINSIYTMVQKEVAQKLMAKDRKDFYGPISLYCQYYYDVKMLKIYKSECFTPSPKVDSAFIELQKHNKYKLNKEEEQKLFKLIKHSFLHRRKTLVNSLKSLAYEPIKLSQILEELGLNPQCRPEQLSLENYIEISKRM